MSKEKTREIKVWVDAVALEQFLKHSYGYSVTIRNKPFGQSDCEVTLLIKEPEKTATLTETEFHQMTRDFDNQEAVGAFRFWYKKLFGSET